MIGQTLSHYRITAAIGAGGMGEVYRATPLTDALAATHDKGVVHRDLEPANVTVVQGGRVKVLDLGLVEITGAGSRRGYSGGDGRGPRAGSSLKSSAPIRRSAGC